MAAQPMNPAEQHKILIVDDDPDSLFLTQNLLRSRLSPAVLQPCNSAEAALQLFERGQTFDVVVTDQTMARMDGLSLVRALRSRGLQTPIVVTCLRPDIRNEALAAGASYFVDPSEGKELATAVQQALRDASADRPGKACFDYRSSEE